MAVLAANVAVPHGANARFMRLPAVGADEFYEGGIVVYDSTSSDATGYIKNPAGGTADVFAGIVAERTTTTAQGDTVLVMIAGEALIAYNGTPAVTHEGRLLYRDISANSDNPGDLVIEGSGGTGDVAIGRVIKFESATLGAWIMLRDWAAIATHA